MAERILTDPKDPEDRIFKEFVKKVMSRNQKKTNISTIDPLNEKRPPPVTNSSTDSELTLDGKEGTKWLNVD